MATITRLRAVSIETAPALLRDVARLHVRAQRALIASHATSATHCTILSELGRGEPMTLAELARQLRLDKSWTSRAIDQMVDEGLVAKKPGATDRRTIALSLTRAGAAQHSRLETLLNDQVARVIARVPKTDRAAVARCLQLLHNGYVDELAAESDSEEAIVSATR